MDDKLSPVETKSKREQMSGFVRALSEPLSQHGWPTWLVYVFAVIGVIYLLNPTLGVLEFLPDNLPIIGNLDESVAVMLVLAGIVEMLEGEKNKADIIEPVESGDPIDPAEPTEEQTKD